MQFKRSKYLVLTVNYLIPILVALLTIAIYVVVFHTTAFQLVALNCELDYQPCNNPTIQAELAQYQGHNLFTLDTTQLQNRLLSGDFSIRSATLTKDFPHTLELTLLSTYPTVAVQQLDHPQEWVTLDQRQRIIAVRSSFPNVPVLLVTSLPAFQLGGEFDDKDLKSSLQSVLTISKELPSLESVSLRADFNLELSLPGNKTAILSSSKDLLPQLHTLQSLLLSPNTLKEHSLIDLRFAQPVLK